MLDLPEPPSIEVTYLARVPDGVANDGLLKAVMLAKLAPVSLRSRSPGLGDVPAVFFNLMDFSVDTN
ncbi:hypothetical protein ACVHYJ_17400 [Burkholderia pyrrocinia]